VGNLRNIYEKQMAEFQTIAHDFNWESKEAYGNWLGQTYHFASVTTRLLALAASHFTIKQQIIHNRFIDHAKEERGHEQLILRDLQSLSLDINAIPELAETAAMYQIQFYWIQHKDPHCFFGYIVLLEGLASTFGSALLDRVETAHGKKATSFVRVHATEDIDHIDKALKSLEGLDSNLDKMISENFRISSRLYLSMLQNINIAVGGKLRQVS